MVKRLPKLRTTAKFDPELFLAEGGKGRTRADYHSKHIIFSQGDPADAIFYIQQGKIKLTVVSRQGKEAVIAILCTGDFLGEGCLAGQPLRMATDQSAQSCGWKRQV